MISFHMITNPGGRDYNEDCADIFRRENKWCCVLADGLGGMGGGAEASSCVVEVIRQCFESGYLDESTMLDCCQRAHRAIQQLKKDRYQTGRMFSTIVLLYGTDKELYWVHSGDSRLYLFQGTELIFQTRDHSVPQMLVTCGEIQEDQLRGHPDRNRLLACLGVEEEEAKLSPLGGMELTSGLSALLCSDGFWEPVTEDQMLDTLNRSHSVKAWLEKMHKLIDYEPISKDQDNYTAIGMWCL